MKTDIQTDVLKNYPALDNHWFIACSSNTLGKNPQRSIVCGIPLVLFRTESGAPAALHDRCPHRNAPLSKGRVIAGHIQCPYHGWQFDGEGHCQRIPGLLRKKSLSAYGVTNFPVVEQEGFIWVYVSSRRQSPSQKPFQMPLHGNASYVSFVWKRTVQASLLNAAENLLDGTHTHFVHAGLIRTDQHRSPLTATVQTTANQVEVTYQNEALQSGLIARLFDRHRSRSYGRFLLPSVAQLEYQSKERPRMLITAFLIPISQSETQAYIVTTYTKTFIPAWFSHLLVKPLFWLALQQDCTMLKHQSKNILSFGQEDFHSTELDLVRTPIRQLLSKPSNSIEQDSVLPSVIQMDL